MNRRDIELLARAIRAGWPAVDNDWRARGNVARILASTLSKECSGFDSDRFLKACGVNNEPS